MQVIARAGNDNLAVVYLARKSDDKIIEFVEAVQPPLPREEKWVLIISTMFGCPVKCRFCDAGGSYHGMLSAEDMLFQIDYPIAKRFSKSKVPVLKFKVQFARLGEPALNDAVLDVIECLASRYEAPGLMPCISTIAPAGRERFFDRLLSIKNRSYDKCFQLQFSVHTTDKALRDWLVPAKKWDFSAISHYGNAFYSKGGRKITLNFALAEGMPVNARELLTYFSPETFLIKITPLNPTARSSTDNLHSYIKPGLSEYKIINDLRSVGYEVLLSIGEWEENKIGSNCGQYITHYLKSNCQIKDGYTYPLMSLMPSTDAQDLIPRKR